MALPQYARGEESIEAMRTGQQAKADMHGVVPKFRMHRVARKDGTLHEFEVLEKLVPGDLKSVPIIKVTDVERQMFPEAYEAFKKGEGFEIDGTSLELFLGRDDPRIPDLRYHKVMTVEALAGLTDTQIQGLGLGYRELRDKARTFVDRLTGPEALIAENAAMKETLAKMQKQLDGLAGNTNGDTSEDSPSEDPDSVEAPKTGGLTVKHGYGGKFVVVDSDGKTLFSATDKGAKAKCEAWVAQNLD